MPLNIDSPGCRAGDYAEFLSADDNEARQRRRMMPKNMPLRWHFCVAGGAAGAHDMYGFRDARFNALDYLARRVIAKRLHR